MNTDDRRLRRIVIVGGGSAGWMSAAALANATQGQCEITLVESEAIGTVGVGEATIPPIRLFNRVLGLDEREFLRRTKGTFKLGIQFVDWAHQGHSYFHPFGPHGRNFDTVSLHHHWLRARESGETSTPLHEHSMAWAAASRNRFAPPVQDPRNVLSTYDYAYHFDAGLYAAFLREYSEAKGVERREGTVTDVHLNSDSGFVESVQMASGERIEGDLFIDCSGFRALLIGEAMKVGYRDWSDWLPCDRAVTVASAPGELTPYTRSTAHAAGWQWRIPLQHRTGNGYVYCSRHISRDEAAATLLKHLDGERLGEPRELAFTTGRREKFWEKNVVAVGLSSGFMEPLESTSLHLVQAAISRLLGFFPDRDFDSAVIDEYNRITINEFERIRDFLILHYKLTERDDSPLWRECRDMPVPTPLENKLYHFGAYGRLIADGADLFGPDSWLAVHVGQNHRPKRVDPLLAFRTVDGGAWLEKLRAAVTAAADQLPEHQAFIHKYCSGG
ncbi:tryptophan halogenase family protein [Marinimicrobium koreense]|uniref:tryptophan halogenase family protein n=1 Tax=Marinimicrobium koreense TaxID=306545 RepID=UPI003F6EBFAC